MNTASNVKSIQGEQTEHGYIAAQRLGEGDGQERFQKLQARRPWYFNAFGDLKNKYRNRKCICASGLKIKDCCGIKYL